MSGLALCCAITDRPRKQNRDSGWTFLWNATGKRKKAGIGRGRWQTAGMFRGSAAQFWVFAPLGGSVLHSYSVGKRTLSKIPGLRNGNRMSRPWLSDLGLLSTAQNLFYTKTDTQ